MKRKTFGERLCELRESKGWLQRDLGFRVGVKANTISNWEKGISRPNLDQICQLCQVLSVTSDTLLGLDKTPMERPLNLKEQRILSDLRSLDDEMQSRILYIISAIGHMNSSLHEKSETLECAERFIETAGLQGEWEETKKEELIQDEE